MNHVSIVFQFEDQRSAYDAFDTLEELGYRPTYNTEEDKPKLHIHLNHSDLTSALEVAQAHGGTFIEHQEYPTMTLATGVERPITEQQAFQMSYNLREKEHGDHGQEQETRIPAHLINEDWTDDYADISSTLKS